MVTTRPAEQLPYDASTYHRLIVLLERHNAQYRLIDHPAEGRTEIVSPMRGNERTGKGGEMHHLARQARQRDQQVRPRGDSWQS
jgi:hypothetical protein